MALLNWKGFSALWLKSNVDINNYLQKSELSVKVSQSDFATTNVFDHMSSNQLTNQIEHSYVI